MRLVLWPAVPGKCNAASYQKRIVFWATFSHTCLLFGNRSPLKALLRSVQQFAPCLSFTEAAISQHMKHELPQMLHHRNNANAVGTYQSNNCALPLNQDAGPAVAKCVLGLGYTAWIAELVRCVHLVGFGTQCEIANYKALVTIAMQAPKIHGKAHASRDQNSQHTLQ